MERKQSKTINIGDKIWPDVSRPVDFDKRVSDEDLEDVIAKSNCEDYSEWINYYSKKYEVNSILVLALMMQESSCDELVVSADKSSYGLMQVNAGVHCGTKGLPSDVEECKEQLKDPEINIRVGIEILKGYYSEEPRRYVCSSFESKTSNQNEPTVDKSYSGWERALRNYNGWGCAGYRKDGSEIFADHDYVEKINNRYALLGVVSDVA